MTMTDSETGSDDWWREVARRGTPWIDAGDDGRCRVTFLWRDPQGDELTSPIRRVWLNITGVTDHHQNAGPQGLSRLAGTDVWHWSTELSATWRGSYCFIPRTDDCPFGAGNGPTAMAERRNVWRGLLAGAQADAFNPQRSWMGARGHAVSGAHLPLAPAQTAWREFDTQGPMPPPPPAALERRRWHSDRLGNSRDIWIFTTGQCDPARRPLAILLDGRFWSTQMPVWSPLMQLTAGGQLPEAVYLLIDAGDTARRGRELPGNAQFWLAVQEELLPRLGEWAPYQSDPATTVVAGQSFGGLSAMYAALNWPERFGCVLSQSGSYWWPNRDLAAPGESCRLLRQLEDGLGASGSLKMFIEAGQREPLIRQVNDRLVAILGRTRHRVTYRVVDGGHDALCWRGGLLDGLRDLWAGL